MTLPLPSVPPGCTVTGRLEATDDPSLLHGDMLEVYCPATETLICADWFPEEDPAGAYGVTLYRDGQSLGVEFESPNPSEVLVVVERLAREHQSRTASDRSSASLRAGESPTER